MKKLKKVKKYINGFINLCEFGAGLFVFDNSVFVLYYPGVKNEFNIYYLILNILFEASAFGGNS
jgi:hypothetical protein